MVDSRLPIESIVELPPESPGEMTFHLPLEVFALEYAGASPALIEERIEARLDVAYRSGLVDPPMYRWASETYRPVAERLLSESAEERLAAFASIEALGDGLVGAAFHGMIRTGYGSLRRDPDEIARGLAYLRTRRQVLQGAGLGGSSDVADSFMPTPDVFDGNSIFDQLSMASSAGIVNELTDPTQPIPPAGELIERAAELVRHDASSFVAIHSMTGLHGLAEFHVLVTGEPPTGDLNATPLASWWRSYAIGLQACCQVVLATPTCECSPDATSFTSSSELLAASIESGDTHSVKIVVSMHRLAAFGLLDDATLLELGRIKLDAEDC